MGLVFESMTYDLLLIAISLAFYLYLTIRKKLRYFEDSGIPHVPCRGILENNTFGVFASESIGESYDKIYKKLAGHKYGGFFNVLKPCIIVRDPELIQTILIKDFQAFNDHGLPADEETNPLEANLFLLSGPRWRALRRKLSPTFTSGKLKGMFGLIGDCTGELVKYINDKAGSYIEVKELISSFTTDVIGSCAFGLEPTSIKNPNNQFRKMGKQAFNPGLILTMKNVLRFMMPGLFKKYKIPVESAEITKFFQSLTAQTFEHRIKTGEKRNDFVQLLLQLKLQGQVETDPEDLQELDGEEIGEQEIVKLEFTDKLLSAQSFVFFVAGFETTASAISFTLYLLGKNVECQEKARQEVKEVKEKNGGVITYDACKSMHYLEACVTETLRLYPPFYLLPRKCTRDCEMEDGFIIKKDTDVFIPTYSLHRDPEYFPEPEKFKPERFLGDQGIITCTYLPFGFGPRTCIARRFALLEAQLALAVILDNFEFMLNPKTSGPIKMLPQSFVAVAKDGLWLKFEKIKN